MKHDNNIVIKAIVNNENGDSIFAEGPSAAMEGFGIGFLDAYDRQSYTNPEYICDPRYGNDSFEYYITHSESNRQDMVRFLWRTLPKDRAIAVILRFRLDDKMDEGNFGVRSFEEVGDMLGIHSGLAQEKTTEGIQMLKERADADSNFKETLKNF